jgi:hypothetical protein
MVATALMILSTFGLEMVDPIYILFMVDDFLISISSSSFEFIFIFREFKLIINTINYI